MRAPTFALFLVLFLFTASSCCKVGCVYQSLHLRFVGYDWQELDSVLIKKYEPNTNFTVLIDSIYERSASTGGDGLIFLDDVRGNVDLSKDYQVYVPVSNKTYNISSITTAGFSCPCETRRGKKVDSYVVEGVRHFQEEVHLER